VGAHQRRRFAGSPARAAREEGLIVRTRLESLGLFWRAADPRSRAEIESDIGEELAFHIDACARDLEREGMDAESAHAEAQRRFGDVAEVQRACARIEIGERIMLQRIQLVLTILLLCAVVLLAVSSLRAQAQIRAQGEINQALLARLQRQDAPLTTTQAVLPNREQSNGIPPEMVLQPGEAAVLQPGGVIDRRPAPAPRNDIKPADGYLANFDQDRGSWRHGLDVATRLADLTDGSGVDILLALWWKLSPTHREQAMKPFMRDGGHPRVLEILHAGAKDQDDVRTRAFFYLRRYAFRDLLIGEETYDAWHLRNEGRSIADVLRASLREAADAIERSGDHLYTLEWVDDVDARTFEKAGLNLGQALVEAGLPQALATRDITDLDPSDRRRRTMLEDWIRQATPAKK
jgi:hypothetical protein